MTIATISRFTPLPEGHGFPSSVEVLLRRMEKALVTGFTSPRLRVSTSSGAPTALEPRMSQSMRPFSLSKNQCLLAFSLLLFVLSVVVLAVAVRQNFTKKALSAMVKKADYQLLVKRAGFMPEPDVITYVIGLVVGKNEQNRSLIVKITHPQDPLDYFFADSTRFRVIVPDQTEIIEIKPEDPAKITEAFAAYQEALKTGQELPLVPDPYSKKRLSFEEVMVSNQINVRVEFRSNVKFKGEGVAQLIELRSF
ncbi:hypothetical protein HY546_03375 [archaeon]|nr:hypothetical protein [archaeon]